MKWRSLIALLVLAGCAPAPSVGVATTAPTVAPVSTGSPSATRAPTPSIAASASPEQPAELTITRFAVKPGEVFETLVELHNPNATWGLVRSGFDLTALDKDGDVLAVTGSEGFDGAACCTIFNLPPGGDYPLFPILSDPQDIASFEIRSKGPWVAWADIAPPAMTVSGAKLKVSNDDGLVDARVTGRVSIDEGGPYNVVLFALVEGSDGFGWISGDIDCAAAGRDYPFEAQHLGGPLPVQSPKLVEVIARSTTVPGLAPDLPPGC